MNVEQKMTSAQLEALATPRAMPSEQKTQDVERAPGGSVASTAPNRKTLVTYPISGAPIVAELD